MSYGEQELLTLPRHMSSHLVFSGVRVVRFLVFFVMLFVLFFWPLCCLVLQFMTSDYPSNFSHFSIESH